MIDWIISDDVTEAITAVYDLRDIHIDASKADDMDTATLANLLIYPTAAEFEPDDTGRE